MQRKRYDMNESTGRKPGRYSTRMENRGIQVARAYCRIHACRHAENQCAEEADRYTHTEDPWIDSQVQNQLKQCARQGARYQSDNTSLETHDYRFHQELGQE